MNFEEILNCIETLSLSQGFYGRLLRDIKEIEKNDFTSFLRFKNELEEQNFKDILDVVMYFEN